MSQQPTEPNTGAPNSAPSPQNPQPQAPNVTPAPQAPQNPAPPPTDDQARRDAHNASQSLLDTRAVADLRTEIQALPERMVRAYREAFQPPQSPPQSTPQRNDSGTSTTHTPGEGNPNRSTGDKFRDWWFKS